MTYFPQSMAMFSPRHTHPLFKRLGICIIDAAPLDFWWRFIREELNEESDQAKAHATMIHMDYGIGNLCLTSFWNS